MEQENDGDPVVAVDDSNDEIVVVKVTRAQPGELIL